MKADKTFILITGASRGFGRALALEWAPFCSQGSVIVLMARTEEGLLETQNLIKSINTDIDILIFVDDCNKPDTNRYQEIFREVIRDRSGFERGFLFHNAGTVGPQGKTVQDLTDVAITEEYFRVNLTSMMTLNAVFIQIKEKIRGPCYVINISSITAHTPIKTWAYYCTGKAARRMFFRVLAEESPDIRVLNYSPGCMSTDIYSNLINDPETSVTVKNLLDCDVLKPETSAAKLSAFISRDTFKSGDHIDFYDI